MIYLFRFPRSSECDSLPLLKLLGKQFDINVTNARLYIKSLEMKVLEIIEVIRVDEVIIRFETISNKLTHCFLMLLLITVV